MGHNSDLEVNNVQKMSHYYTTHFSHRASLVISRSSPFARGRGTEEFANPSTGHARPANQDSTTVDRGVEGDPRIAASDFGCGDKNRYYP